MAGWKGFGDWLKKVQDSGYYFSDYDLQRAADDQNFADQAYGYKDTYAKATTQEEKDAAHAGMENLRAGTQYSGGADGSEYNPWEEKQENPLPSYIKETPKYSGAYDADIAAAKDRVLDRGSYVSPYKGYIQEAVSKILNRDPFSYDLESDPSWAAYKKQYTREGQRAMQNTLGEIAARTGGVPSSYAVTAAQQANDYYMSQMADKIPELYKAAYAMYQNEGNDMLQRLSMLRGLDSDAYGRWGDEGDRLLQQLAMLQGLDDTEYSRWGDQRDYERKVYENDRNFDYETEQDRQARELALAQLGISLGDYSGAEALGIDTGEARDAVFAYGSGDPYKITSQKGLAFVTGAQPGQTMRGGDGSTWTKNADGSVSITRGDDSWSIAAPAAKTGTGGGYSGGGDGGTDPVTAFNSGDHSDAVIKALMDMGYTQEAIENGGYTGDFFGGSGTGGSTGASRADHVYQTIMNQAIYGGSLDDVRDYAVAEIEKGLGDGSISEEEADEILRIFGY